MSENSDLLLRSAARLYSLGVDLDAAREKLRRLVDKGVSYESAEMRQAYESFRELEAQWAALEKEHLSLREQLRSRRS